MITINNFSTVRTLLSEAIFRTAGVTKGFAVAVFFFSVVLTLLSSTLVCCFTVSNKIKQALPLNYIIQIYAGTFLFSIFIKYIY